MLSECLNSDTKFLLEIFDLYLDFYKTYSCQEKFMYLCSEHTFLKNVFQ